ncbi:MAG: ABC transporter ATP-binding protein/permease [Acidimicrobiia bacterium]|nr:ABC transporter ATP-binding protein/permease [Acidimicrobiia bacterium]
MKDRESTTKLIGRAIAASPVLAEGLRLTLLMAMIGQGVTIVTPIVLQQIIDEEILNPAGVDIEGVLIRAAIATVAVVVGIVVGRAALLRLIRSSSVGLSDMRTMTFNHLLRQSVLHVQAERRGNLVSRVTSDVTTLQEFMEWGGVSLVVASSQVLLATGVMFFYQWRLALISLVGVVLYLFLMRWFQRILRKNYDAVRIEVGKSLGVLSEAITAIPVVRAYGTEEATKEKVADALEARFRREFRTNWFGNSLFSSAEIFAGLLTAAIVVAGVVIGVNQGMTAGELIAFFFLANLLIEPLQIVVETLEFSQSAASGLRRVLEVLDSEIEIEDPVDPEHLRDGGLSVRFQNVRFAYPTGPIVLENVSVDIGVGARVAVVGETGSGKTTFSKLLVRLLDPTEGEIRVGGVNLARVPLAQLRSRVAFVPQEGFLFDDTIANNVRYGHPEATDAEIWSAFHELDLGGWLSGLPNGLQSMVGERGGNISAGERQLVALVRAWISSPDLLVLDEATSAVDRSLDVQLLTEGRTAVTVAHRLATAENADEVLVFQDGRLVERGPHRDLIAAGGVYAALFADWSAGTKTI